MCLGPVSFGWFTITFQMPYAINSDFARTSISKLIDGIRAAAQIQHLVGLGCVSNIISLDAVSLA